jgi:PAS domain S-box-containing protein
MRFDSAFRFTLVNQAAEHLLGAARADLLGKGLWEVYPELLATPIEGSYRRAMTERIPVTFDDYHAARKRWYAITAAPDSEDGILVRTLDITDRKRAEAALHFESRITKSVFSLLRFVGDHSMGELLQETLDEVCGLTGSKVGFYHFVLEDQQTLSLQAWSTATLRDYCKAEGQGLHYDLDMAGVWADCARERRAVIHNDYQSLAHRKGLPPGHAEVLRELVVPVLKRDRLVAILGVGNKPADYDRHDLETVVRFADLAWDIAECKRSETVLKQTENALRESEALLLETGEIAKVGGWKLDLSANKLTWSPEVRRIHEVDDDFEPTVEGAIGFYAPESRAVIQQAVRRAIEHGDPFDLELEIITAKDRRLWVHAIGKIQGRNGGPGVLSGTFQDIGTRKRMEGERDHLQRQLAQAHKMESVGRLAGGVAHDFNNLLTVINGYSRMLLTDLEELDPVRESVEEIYKAGERAARLTRQLLAFSRKQVLEPRKLDINHVVEEMRRMLERLMGEDIEVLCALHADNGVVQADPHQLEQVVMNLAVNARDAMPEGGKLSIETALVERDQNYVQYHPDAHVGRYVMLAVSDNGVGMDEKTRQEIFEPFFTTKEIGKGTGLGLSMVQGIVLQSGGYVEVYSEKDHGTSFKIYLPALTDAADDEWRPEAAAVQGGKESVLVVEDQAEVRKYAVAALTAKGYRVMAAGDAGEALLLCEQERIDLVLTDVVMPNVSGRELADRLQALQPGIKVLFMSRYTNNVIEQHGVLEGGANFIQKPFSREELAGKVRAVLGTPAPAARILVVDDEAGVRCFLRKVLEQAGYEVTETANGKQALQHARAGGVDLVITDLVMPEQEGIETIQALRRDVPGIGIIAISGAFGGAFLKVAQLMGAAAVLNKPLNADLLLARVAEVLESRR